MPLCKKILFPPSCFFCGGRDGGPKKSQEMLTICIATLGKCYSCLEAFFLAHILILLRSCIPCSIPSQITVDWKSVHCTSTTQFGWHIPQLSYGLCQCWKFLSPGRPRLPVLGLGDLLPEAGSPGGRTASGSRSPSPKTGSLGRPGDRNFQHWHNP